MWKKILGAAIVLGALCAGIYMWMSHLAEEPVKVIQSQLDAIARNDIPTAYGYLAPRVKSHVSLDQFRALMEQNSAVMKSQGASFPFRQFYYRGGTLFFERNSEPPPGNGFPQLSDTYLRDTLDARRGLNNVAVIRGFLAAQGAENTKVRFLLMEEPDAITRKDHWVIYDFALGKW